MRDTPIPQTPLALDVALTPAYVASAAPARRRTTFIVVDVIRATTTLCVLFERGCRRVLVAPGIAEARAYRDASGRDALLAGEAGGVAPAGFDFGNSPAEFERAPIVGKEIIFATTNGTRALRACAEGRAVFAGALRNAHAVCAAALASALSDLDGNDETDELGQQDAAPNCASEAAIAEREPDIVIVCSGRAGRPAYDDTICAGYLVGKLLLQAETQGSVPYLHEGARIALAAAREAMRGGELHEALVVSDAARAITRVGLSGDLAWCAAIDAADVVPAVTGTTPERLMLMERLATATATATATG